MAKEGRFNVEFDIFTPASQTLIVWSFDPDTIFVPSGEKATERTQLLWALGFSLFSSSVPAREAGRRQFWPRRGDSTSNSTYSHLRPRL